MAVLLHFQKIEMAVLAYSGIHRCLSEFNLFLSDEADVAFGFSTHLTGDFSQ